MQFPYRLSDDSISIYIDGEVYATERTNPSWDLIKAEVNKEQADRDVLLTLIAPVSVIIQAVEKVQEISVRNGAVFYGDEKVHDNLAKRLLDVMAEGFSLDPWLKFTQNIYANPAKFARQEFYDFLESADLPITPDGCFLAYKIVDNNYKDLYSGKFDNSVGRTVILPGGRPEVDPNRNNTCSKGLHFCSKGYLGSYGTRSGSRVMIVKINPSDVVSIPIDYNYAKGRTWRYQVVGEMDRDQASQYTWKAVQSYGLDDSEWDEYDDVDDVDDYYDQTRTGSYY